MPTQLKNSRFTALYLALMMTAVTTLLTAQLFAVSPSGQNANPATAEHPHALA